MQRGWGKWSPLAGELAAIPSAWERVTAEQQCVDRPYDYLPDLELVLEVAARSPGPVLDLACGNGRLALALARNGYEVVGLDLNPAFLARARAEAEAAGTEVAARLRFETGDARSFRLPERFGTVVMMDQAFKYLLRHDDHLDCLHAVREHLRPAGRFLVEHRCLFQLPEAGEGEPYECAWQDRDWIAVDLYDPVQQVGLTASRPVDDPAGPAELEPIRDFTYAEVSLLHRVTGFELEEVVHDLDERSPATTYFDCALVLRPGIPWQPRPR